MWVASGSVVVVVVVAIFYSVKHNDPSHPPWYHLGRYRHPGTQQALLDAATSPWLSIVLVLMCRWKHVEHHNMWTQIAVGRDYVYLIRDFTLVGVQEFVPSKSWFGQCCSCFFFHPFSCLKIYLLKYFIYDGCSKP